MSTYVKTLAEKYYPTLWPKNRMNALLSAEKLTQNEYNEVVGTTADAGSTDKK